MAKAAAPPKSSKSPARGMWPVDTDPNEVPTILSTVAAAPGTPARALEFLALTGARVPEVLSAQWTEINMDARTWTIAGQRRMSGSNLVVPLSKQAIKLLGDLDRTSGSDLVFAFPSSGAQISRPSLARVLHQLPVEMRTASSFRSAFRVWLSTIATQDQHKATMQFLSRREFLPKKFFCHPRLDNGYAQAMQAWADFCKPMS